MFTDLTALAQALDSEQAHTSFGKLPLSIEKTAAQFSFTQANRWDGSKIFVNELTKQENIGKNAPGPQYMYDDKIKYADVSDCRLKVLHRQINGRTDGQISPLSK